MLKKLLIAALLLLPTGAFAQNVNCPTRPTGDNTNACASTAFVHGGFQPTLTLPLSISNGGTGTSSPGLTAGSNIVITGAWPNNTISSSGGAGSGVVGSGLLNQFAKYPSNGTSVIGTAFNDPLLGPNANNIVAYGADPTGSVDSTAAINNALAASAPANIYIPCGSYKVNSNIAVTMPTSATTSPPNPTAVTIRGGGRNCTFLNWPNTGGGFTFTYSNMVPNLNLSDMTLTTSQINSGTAISLQGPTTQNYAQPGGWQVIQNVEIRGQDGPGGGGAAPVTSTAGTEYWSNGIVVFDVSNVNLVQDTLYSVGQHGNGVTVGGTGGAYPANIASILNMTDCNFNYWLRGLYYQNGFQGVSIKGTNFTSNQVGINQDNGFSPNFTAELSITGSQFGMFTTGAFGIFLGSGVVGASIGNNVFVMQNGTSKGIQISGVYNFSITGNYFEAESKTSQEGIDILGWTKGAGAIEANVFENFTTSLGAVMESTAQNLIVTGNICYDTTAPCISSAAGASVHLNNNF